MKTFIETQFPIARISAEAYKERKAGASQTLTGLGKWWGRKPLILVRASIIGMLMPSSNDHKKDREIFLKILTMDDDGTWERSKPIVKRKMTKEDFNKLPYAERISNCVRPENFEGPSKTAWIEINSHLKTKANSLSELIEQLGKRTFGNTPKVGDSFCGGGSIPFEAARIGCEVFASDLNPIAGLLTWTGINLLGGSQELQERVRLSQQRVFAETDQQITKWGIEHNELGERAEVFLYCVEVKPEGCEYFIPLAPSWVISEKSQVVTKWKRVENSDQLVPVVTFVDDSEFKHYKVEKKGATIVNGRVVDPFDSNRSWSIEALRGTEGLRKWSNQDLVPRSDDVFQERLYCIRWSYPNGKWRYAAPNDSDLLREKKVLDILKDNFEYWQENGYVPSKKIISGYNTDQPTRERGWTYWHHLFTPRQLLVHGELISRLDSKDPFNLPRIGNLADFNSRLTRYPSTRETINNTFSNQALNTMFNFPCRGFTLCENVFVLQKSVESIQNTKLNTILLSDARDIVFNCDIWITDPPYADAVNYHELADFFLAWYEKQLSKVFPNWVIDSRSELAVKGDGEDFRRSMVDIYSNLAKHMHDNGMQMVMFTHQNPAVWADLGMILWGAGLKVTAAWTISTETEAGGIKKGNYVQGTVCLVLRKRLGNEPGFLDEVYPLVEDEVKLQIQSMQALDEDGEPNFNDADYQLAAYAAALKVLTQYASLDGKAVEHELFAVRDKTKKSDFEIVIERALGIACDTLIPKNLNNLWRDLSLVERYYLRAIEIESRGERRQGMYEELARGFGVTDVKPLLKNDKANGARMYTPSGLTKTLLASVSGSKNNDQLTATLNTRTKAASVHPFASSPLRHLMFAIRETAVADNNPELGRQYLRDTFGQLYWTKRESFVELLDWLATIGNTTGMTEWVNDSEASRILAGRLRNDNA